ncbi:MAG: fibronectin type III domain-containing protein, partial [Ruminococcus sp.]|nr:fibronectin type III domain-containing protein [Ruminococcus sp.]
MKGSMKKSCLKRTLAFISALSIIGSFSSTIGTTEMISDYMISAAATDGTTPQNSTEPTGKYSRIDIEVSNKFDFVNEVKCTVSVIKVNPDKSEANILSDVPLTIGNEINSTESISTNFIENGTYIVEIHAPGFETFKQEISDFDNMICLVKVTLGFDNLYTYIDKYKVDENGETIYKEDGTPVIDKAHGDHPGAMKIGDVNGDGRITKRDETLLLEAIDSSIMNNGNIEVNLEENEKLCSDLNYDGVTNLADLTFFTKGYIDTKDWHKDASLIKDVSEEYKIAALSKVETLGNTESNGVTMADLLKNSSNDNDDNKSDKSAPKLELKPAPELVPVMNEDGTPKVDENNNPVYEEKEAKISEKNPVGVSMDLEGVQVKEMTFGTNADAGSIDVELEDGTLVSLPFQTNSQFTTDDELEAVGEGKTSDTDIQPVTEASSESDDDNTLTTDIQSTTETETETTDESETTTETPAPVISESNVSVKIDENGNISLNLENQIAIKKITLKITKVKNAKLAEIGTVEFLNGMEERISEPEIDFPTDVKVEQNCKVADKDAEITATWKKTENSGSKFEFEVSTSSATKADGSFSSTISGIQDTEVESPTFTLKSEHGNFKLIKINTTYYVHVRCIDEDYKSKWSDYAKVTTVSNSRPDKPDYVSAKGDFRSLKVSWGSDNTNSTTGYKLYYRDITNNLDENGRPTGTYNVVDVGKTTSYTLNGLEDKTEYEVYVVGYNTKGESPESVHAMGKTISAQPVEMRKYNAINCDDDGNTGNTHIVSVVRGGGNMINSLKDTAETEKIENKYNEIINDENATQAEKNAATKNKNAELAKLTKTAWGVVDGNQESYYSYGSWNDGGITYEFDNEYELSTIALSVPYSGPNFFQTWITAWDENGNAVSYSGWKGMSRTKDKNGKEYFLINFPKVKAKKIKLSFGNYAGEYREIAYSEIIFYHYDSIMEEIMALYVDDLHTVLRDDVTHETIDALRDRIVLPDKRNGEYHPNKANLENELNTAEKLLNAENISKPIFIHNSITTYDPISKGTSRRYSGLNAWQPLGVSAGANTEITVYVGSPNMKTGDNTELKLIATQYNSESNGLTLLNNQPLKIGANTFTIPGGAIAGAEAGGALYIQHHGGDQSKVYYSVRVEGGTEVPFLDLYKITDDDERFNRAADYIEALEVHVANMENEHNRVHKGSEYIGERNSKLDYDYDKKLCIAGATDILCDTMMYSLPAHQILAGLGNGSVEERAEKLIRSMESMEEMMELFYQHKGMSYDAVNVVDRIPNQHLNIRYQRMFQGAAMYAAGNHIGIQWGTASSMVNSKGVKADENGRYVSGSYFGWGIAHELGHNINDSSYVL